MKRNMNALLVGLLAFVLGALAVYSFSPKTAQAAMVEPVAIPDEYVLALDKETGLPVGAIVFALDGLVCVALPNGAMECACPCDTDTCDASETVPVFVPDNMPDRVPDDTPADSSTDTPPVETPSDGDTDTPPTVVPGDSDDDTPPDDGDNGDNSHNSCNQGRGNGAEGCDPGNSNHNQPSNDEGAVNRGGNPTPNRNSDNGNNGKAKGKDKDK